jgi:hypothetical protein
MPAAEVVAGKGPGEDALVGRAAKLISAVEVGGDLESRGPGVAEPTEHVDRRTGGKRLFVNTVHGGAFW